MGLCGRKFVHMCSPHVKATPLEYSDSKERQAYYAQFKRLGLRVMCICAFYYRFSINPELYIAKKDNFDRPSQANWW